MTPLLPAFYFGSVEHYRLLARYPKVVIDLGEHYVRQTDRSRTRIMGPNGVQDLSVQVAHDHGRKMPMVAVRLSHAETWPQQHLHAIRSAYGKTPWFIHYIDELEAVILERHDRLVDLDLATLRLGMRWLGLSTEVVVSEAYIDRAQLASVSHLELPDPAYLDLRTTLHPKKPLPAEVPPTPAYPQVFADRHGFQARMSIIDLVCNTGPEAPRYVRS